ncbi:RDD family protein [Frigidibacter sp. ROC022]|uniref:RDD family protein n=1 Tax=Frigidibacter sp. ROC022 TaxID=2971796 RepID=UPI00215B1F4B|nr:RDD family protein [Frigidibacter sp. ROC022]MCR8723791.1 RDD family protein [Frigidibacter sp. ROC022]
MTAPPDRDDPLWGLPDPEASPAFYADIPGKRLVAFLADSVIIGIMTVILIPFTAFTALFYLPFLAMLVSFVYRTLTLASGSATWGMRMVAIEMRNHRGERFDLPTAAGHTLLFTLFLGMVVPLLISVGLMLITPRRQGLHDMILGTAALNRPARR